MTEVNLQTEWASLLFASLADAGVTDVVISPGSRSTPLVVAAVRERRLCRHRAIDERAAAFFALGQARVTGRPTVLVCTSGTAPAHYLPAVIEAEMTGTPMILLTGDRPHELYDCRAPQTIDQVKLFGDHVSHFFDLVPDASEESLRSLRRIASQAVLATRWPRPGAVHVNARAKKPLEPATPTGEAEALLAARVRKLAGRPITFAAPPRLAAAPEGIARAAALIGPAARGVIVAGPSGLAQRKAREAIFELASATGFPVAAEATSQLRYCAKPDTVRFIDAFELLLKSKTFRAKAAFDVAIQIGSAPTSSAWEQLAPAVPRVVLAEHGWNDPTSAADVMVFGHVGEAAASLAEALREPRRLADDFLPFIEKAQRSAWEIADREIAASGALVEAAAVRALVDKVPSGSLLVLGNSLSVRLVDIYTRAAPRDVLVLSQRGASGIDGLVAGAAGAAAASKQPTALLLGDVSLLHDLSSLELASRVTTPLVVFVLHNGGGRIFEQLPIVDVPNIEAEIIEHATTPHDTDFAPAAALYGVRYARIASLSEVSTALDEAYAHAGCTLVEVRVEPSGAIALSRRIAQAVERSLATQGRPSRP